MSKEKETTSKIVPSPIKPEYINDDPDKFVDLTIYPEYLGVFEITQSGKLKNKITKNVLTPHIHDGYPFFVLAFNGQGKNKNLHRLLAEQFLINDDPGNKTAVDHIDNDKLNYALSNLRWVTPSENNKNRSSSRKNVVYRLFSEKEHSPEDFVFEIRAKDLTTDEAKRYSYACWGGYTVQYEGKKYWIEKGFPEVEKYLRDICGGKTIKDLVFVETKYKGVSVNLSTGVFKTKTGLTLGTLESSGYRSITVNAGKKLISRLMMETFLGRALNPEEEVDHINTNTLDNRLENLRAVSRKENMNNPLTKKHLSISIRRSSIQGYKKKVAQYSIEGTPIKEFESTCAAERETGTRNGNIVSCCKGKRKTAGGYIWKYVD